MLMRNEWADVSGNESITRIPEQGVEAFFFSSRRGHTRFDCDWSSGVCSSDLVPPGTRVIYSDLNAILLGEAVRRAAGQPLDVFAAREVFTPLGLQQTTFRPPARLKGRIAPTGVWHWHAVAGVVNDGRDRKSVV